MFLEEYDKLGFSSKEEMELYIDVFGGENLKQDTSELLNRKLNGKLNTREDFLAALLEPTRMVPIQKKDYLFKISRDEEGYKPVKLSVLLNTVSRLPLLERFCIIYAHYHSLANHTREIIDRDNLEYKKEFDKLNEEYKEAQRPIADFDEQTLAKQREWYKKTRALDKKYLLRIETPYFEEGTKACNYIKERVKNCLDIESQNKFNNFISSFNLDEYRNIMLSEECFQSFHSENNMYSELCKQTYGYYTAESFLANYGVCDEKSYSDVNNSRRVGK